MAKPSLGVFEAQDVEPDKLRSMIRQGRGLQPVHQAAPPTIYLEVMPPRWVRCTVFLTWFFFILGVILVSIEARFHTTSGTGTVVPLTLGKNVSQQSVKWWSEFDVEPIQLYFSEFVDFTLGQTNLGSSQEIAPSVLTLNLSVTLQGLSQDQRTGWVELSRSSRVVDVQCSRYICEPLWLIVPSQYAVNYEALQDQLTHFYLQVEYAGLGLELVSTMTYHLVTQSTGFRIFDMAFHVFLVILTLILFGLWCWRVHVRGWQNLVPEQRWITVLFIAVLLYQDPFLIPELLKQKDAFRDLSEVSFNIATAFFMTFWLLMLDGLRATAHALQRKEANEAWTVRYNKLKTSKYSCRFYFWKVVFFFSLAAFGVYYVLYTRAQARQVVIDVTKTTSTVAPGGRGTLIFFSILGIGSISWWICWMLWATCETGNTLKSLPYIATRYQQLSFRFFLVQTWCCIFYYLIVFIVFLSNQLRASYVTMNSDYRTGNISTAIFVSSYTYLLAVVYAPVFSTSTTSSELADRGHSFTMINALFLWKFSWQAYFEPPIPSRAGAEHHSVIHPADVTEEMGQLSSLEPVEHPLQVDIPSPTNLVQGAQTEPGGVDDAVKLKILNSGQEGDLLDARTHQTQHSRTVSVNRLDFRPELSRVTTTVKDLFVNRPIKLVRDVLPRQFKDIDNEQEAVDMVTFGEAISSDLVGNRAAHSQDSVPSPLGPKPQVHQLHQISQFSPNYLLHKRNVLFGHKRPKLSQRNSENDLDREYRSINDRVKEVKEEDHVILHVSQPRPAPNPTNSILSLARVVARRQLLLLALLKSLPFLGGASLLYRGFPLFRIHLSRTLAGRLLLRQVMRLTSFSTQPSSSPAAATQSTSPVVFHVAPSNFTTQPTTTINLDDALRINAGGELANLSLDTIHSPSRLTPVPEIKEADKSGLGPQNSEYIDLSEDYEMLHFQYIAKDDTVCFIAQEREPKPSETNPSIRTRTVVISFRGTASKKNAKTDLLCNFIPGTSVFPGCWGQVHKGFGKAYRGVRAGIRQVIDQVVAAERRRTYDEARSRHDLSVPFTERRPFVGFETDASDKRRRSSRNLGRPSFSRSLSKLFLAEHPMPATHPPGLLLYCTGHSLGGALATLCAYDLAINAGLEPQMYNYGSPRVGDQLFALNYRKAVPQSFRIVCDRDMVTGVPKFFVYKHIGLEIIVDRQGNIIVDPTWVEGVLRDSRRSVADHMMSSYLAALNVAMEILDREAEALDSKIPRKNSQNSIY